MAVITAGGHFLLMIAISPHPSKCPAWGQFMGGGALAVGYFIPIIFTTGRQYIGFLSAYFIYKPS